MASGLFKKLGEMARSPEGRRAMDQAKRAAKDPEVRRQLTGLAKKWRKPRP